MSTHPTAHHAHWCPRCQTAIPDDRPDIRLRVAKAVTRAVIGGLFSCGIAWLLIPVVLVIIPSTWKQLCPVCRTKLVARSDASAPSTP